MHYAKQWRCINGPEEDTCHYGTCLVWYRERGAEQMKNKHWSANACFVKLKEISSSVPKSNALRSCHFYTDNKKKNTGLTKYQ